MERIEINNLIKGKKQHIQNLMNEISELMIQEITMSDEVQQYYEKEVEVIISKKPKETKKQLHGFIKWKQGFLNEINGHTVYIERNKLVTINGELI
jgi:hypothetical protein